MSEKEIKFRYKISPNFSMTPVAGVHGGVGAGGDIIANLFSERHPIPRIVKHKVHEDGTLEQPAFEVDSEDAVIRDVFGSISLKPHIARSIAIWLNEKADEAEGVKSSKGDG